jgi:hypothetical protein
MNVSRILHTATALPVAGGLGRFTYQLLVAGGVDFTNGTEQQTTEIYDSAIGSWLPTGNMNVSRAGHTATLLSGGNILLAGGGDSFAEIGTPCDANAMIVVSPSQTIDFGQVEAGALEGVATSNFLPTVQNTGNESLIFEQAISGPDAALFPLSGAVGRDVSPQVAQASPCVAGTITGRDTGAVFVQFRALSPVAKVCQATLTLSGSNAANALPGQTWVFPITAQIVVVPTAVIKIVPPPHVSSNYSRARGDREFSYYLRAYKGGTVCSCGKVSTAGAAVLLGCSRLHSRARGRWGNYCFGPNRVQTSTSGH